MTADLAAMLTTDLPNPTDNPDHLYVSEFTEELGYDALWCAESPESGVFTTLGSIASRNDTLALGTSIVDVYTRSPSVLASAMNSLRGFSDCQLNLGLGVSTPHLVENVHGVPFEDPLTRTEEVVEIVRRITRNRLDSSDEENVFYDGKFFSISDQPTFDLDLNLYNAALGVGNRRLTGRYFDGWLPHNLPFSYLDEAFEDVEEGLEAKGREAGSVRVEPVVPAAVDEDRVEAYDSVRRHLVHYINISKAYRGAMSTEYPDVVEEVYRTEADPSDLVGLIPEEMVTDLGIAGTPEEAREQLRQLRRDTVVDRPIITVVGWATEEQKGKTIRSLSPKEL